MLKIIFVFLFSLYKFHRKPSGGIPKELPGISIIKPLTCIDANLYANLKTFFDIKYPRVCINSIELKSYLLILFSMKYSFVYKTMILT
jgi:hypothetical protein